MQSLLDFGPVLFVRSSKFCVWISSKLFSSSRCYYGGTSPRQTPRETVQWMAEHAPVFPVNGKDITVLNEPEQFFATLKDNVSKANRRIILASLYLGTGEKEQQLVDCIYNAVKRSTSLDKSLDVEILLEHTRGSRGEHNSRTMLLPLIQSFSPSIKVSLYHSPSLRGLLKLLLPERFNETVALTHLKVYLTDDTLIMSGANLSADYFTNRQDRYIEIKNCPQLANFFHSLVSTVRAFSLQLQPDNTTKMGENVPLHPTKGFDGGNKFKAEAGRRVSKFLQNQKEKNNCSDLLRTPDQVCDTWVVPLVQMFPFGIRQDEVVTSKLLSHAPQASKLFLASGYFNLTRKYRNIILKSPAKCEILTAHPTVNGFYQAKGVAGGIPHAYTLLARDFYKQILEHKQADNILVQEYIRHKWTFHVKGLWYYPPNEPLPSLTLIGSPNFGHRSVYRDLEAQVAIVTTDQDLSEALHKEKTNLYSRVQQVTCETFEQSERKIPVWVYCVTRLIKNLL